MINQQTQALLDRFKEVSLFAEHKAILIGKDFVHTIMHYRITYLPKNIVQLIEAKAEDPFDIEGIEQPTMDMITYQKLKSYFLKEIQ
jgi:hypothetical protein